MGGGGGMVPRGRARGKNRNTPSPTMEDGSQSHEAGPSDPPAGDGAARQKELKRIRSEMLKGLQSRRNAKDTWQKRGREVMKSTDAAAAKVGGGKNLSTMEQMKLTADALAGDRKTGNTDDVNQSALVQGGLGGGGQLLLAGKAGKWKAKAKASAAAAERPETPQERAILELGKMADKVAKLKRPKTTDEKRWEYIIRLVMVIDVPICAYFFFQAFLLHSDDRKMDPLGWRLAFGAVVVFVVFRTLVIKLDAFSWFTIWLVFVIFLVCGHFYGACRYFFWIYNLPFPCFKGQAAVENDFDMCYEGKLLVGTATAAAYLVFSAFLLWRWRIWRKNTLRAQGKEVDELSMSDLLKEVDEKIEKQKEKENANIEIAAQAAAAAAAAGRIAGTPKRSGRPQSRGRAEAALSAQADAALPLPQSMNSPHGSSLALSPRPPELSFDQSMLLGQAQHQSFPDYHMGGYGGEGAAGGSSASVGAPPLPMLPPPQGMMHGMGMGMAPMGGMPLMGGAPAPPAVGVPGARPSHSHGSHGGYPVSMGSPATGSYVPPGASSEIPGMGSIPIPSVSGANSSRDVMHRR